MRPWLGGKAGGLLAFLAIAALVAGGLGWATAAALRLEQEQWAERGAAAREVRLPLALWKLDGRVAADLAREQARPFNHYSTIYPPPLALHNTGRPSPPGTLLEPSPLLHAELPAWMLLHFQVDAAAGWQSPQAPPSDLARRLAAAGLLPSLPNITPARKQLLDELAREVRPAAVLAAARERAGSATLHDTTLLLARRNEDLNKALDTLVQQKVSNRGAAGNPSAADVQQQARPTQNAAAPGPRQQAEPQGAQQLGQGGNELSNLTRLPRDLAYGSLRNNGKEWLDPAGRKEALPHAEVTVHLTPMVALWLNPGTGPERLALVRVVSVEDQEVCQGVLLDAGALQEELRGEVADLFPDARLVPVRDGEDAANAMTALPLRLDPGPDEPADPGPGWTPLRFGLALAWAAALVALLAVGLGGWSLLDLSERRIGFVSAVTHELRTPLTTLRLYLDMLREGLVRDPGQRDEYIRTLHAEADRLHRLVGNVLDFSRLEKQRPKPARARAPVDELLAQVKETWQRRCDDAGKSLVAQSELPTGAAVWTDAGLVQQVLGTLVDNACKYSRGAADPRVWVRARAAGRRVAFEVEDRGPGVPPRERRSIFRAFRRGRGVEPSAGGVGLGLALARRWAKLLGGRLTLSGGASGGACFRLELPAGEGPRPAG
jgi:signal transduction histidine kinase